MTNKEETTIVNLTTDDIIMLNLLDCYAKKEITEDMIKQVGFIDIIDFIEKRKIFFNKIGHNKKLLEQIKLLYKDLNIEELINMPKLTPNEFKVLILLNEKRTLPDIEKIKDSDFKNLAAFRIVKAQTIKKLKNSKYLYERVLLILKELDLDYKDSELGLTPDEVNILKTIYENSGKSFKQLAYLAGYDNYMFFLKNKRELLDKIKADDELRLKVLKKFSNIDIEKKEKIDKKTTLTDKNKRLLTLLKDGNLSDSEIAEELGYIDKGSYRCSKYNLFRQLKEHESLKREALKIYPELIIDKKIESISLTFTAMEVNFLQEFCLVKDNNLIYQSMNSIASTLNLSKESASDIRSTSTSKIIKNMFIGTDLDILLWPNFLDEFITRDNFSSSKSINISKNQLLNIETTSTKEILKRGIKMLEESIFKDYISTCNDEVKAILAFRLGYFNNSFFSSDEVADIFNIDVNFVITVTKECLNKSRNNYIETKQKRL